MKLLIVTSILMMNLGIIAPAFASNHGDTDWRNVYLWNSPDDHTPARKKDNTTAYYNKVNSMDGLGYINIWAALYDGRDVSEGHSYKASEGDETRLYNKAVEWHGSGVSVRIDSRRFANGSTSGVWSPDSI